MGGWGGVATKVNHHITIKATQDPTDGRVIRVHRCPNPQGQNLTTCDAGTYSEIRVQKKGPPNVLPTDWFRIWNKDVAKEHYANYWLVADMWWTSNTDFQLSVDNMKFYKDNGEEWIMPLDGPPPKAAAAAETEIVV